MACEDYPCCGHEAGDCPVTDSRGRQRMRCVECGKMLPIKAESSICPKCLRRMQRQAYYGDDHDHSMDH